MLEQRSLGDTGFSVSCLGLGTVKIGRTQQVKYPQPFALPTDQALISLLQHCHTLGITLVDTAPAYGVSEERLGHALFKIAKREEWIVSTKVGESFEQGHATFNFSPEHIHFSIQRSLHRLQTEYLDIVLVHSDGNDVHIIEHWGVFEVLAALKKQGVIRAFGMSTKTVAGGLRTVENADVVMVTYNLLETQERAVIQRAVELNKGVFIKKGLGSGHIGSTDSAIRFVLDEPGVSSLIVGTLNTTHLTQNVSYTRPPLHP